MDIIRTSVAASLIIFSTTFICGPINLSRVHAQQDQKQQGKSTAILIKSWKLGAFNPQRNTFLIDRQQHLFVARFSSATVDPDTSLVDRHSPPPSTEDTLLPSTDIFYPMSIDTSV
ncbi:hypothetical protein F2Q68_00009913 [Brassica cretica]|uniref:Uncharacterized protein n=1 Tax=Brassica cretica TaxID=69181 RepID=A0A8S9KSM9_BRACR|nr:hypothetical protein F2Q68_00009913 [Brassica cretica]